MNPICLSRFGEAKGEKKIGFQSVLCQLPDCEYQCSHSFGIFLVFLSEIASYTVGRVVAKYFRGLYSI